MIKDYAIKMQDGEGRIATLAICADSINGAVSAGSDFETVREDVEANAFWKAVDNGLIGRDAWLIERS